MKTPTLGQDVVRMHGSPQTPALPCGLTHNLVLPKDPVPSVLPNVIVADWILPRDVSSWQFLNHGEASESGTANSNETPRACAGWITWFRNALGIKVRSKFVGVAARSCRCTHVGHVKWEQKMRRVGSNIERPYQQVNNVKWNASIVFRRFISYWYLRWPCHCRQGNA
jgi:hypothetical protein